MTRLEDSSILERSATDEFQNPLPQKVCEDRTSTFHEINMALPSSFRRY